LRGEKAWRKKKRERSTGREKREQPLCALVSSKEKKKEKEKKKAKINFNRRYAGFGEGKEK